MAKFKPGDIVALKSGGPAMTVVSVDVVDEDVQCVWFDGKKPMKDFFKLKTLVRVPVPDKMSALDAQYAIAERL